MSEFQVSYPGYMDTYRMRSDPQEPSTDQADHYYIQFPIRAYYSSGSSGLISLHFKKLGVKDRDDGMSF